MRSPILISLSLPFLTLCSAWAQPADEFFHGGAQLYLSNNIPAAKEAVTNGLKLHPDDVKLKKLSELLNQQQQQQQDQKQQAQDKQDQEKPDEQKSQQSKSDQQNKDEQKKQPEAKDKKEQENKDPQQAKAGDKSKEKPETKTGEQQQIAAHAMTPQEAKQLLDAQKDNEQVLI